LFNLLGMNRYLANGISILAVTGWNYWLNRKLNFAPISTKNRRT
jgi:dolichol-phosphate mannosyltransferase